MTLNELKAASPFPWKTFIAPGGRVMMIDSAQHEVPLFNITGLCELVTGHHVEEPKQAEAA